MNFKKIEPIKGALRYYNGYIQEPLDKQSQLYVNVFAGVDQDEDFYPFRSTNRFIGVLMDRNLSNLNTSY